MLSERLLTNVVRQCTNQYLKLKPTDEVMMPAPEQGKHYMLYMHVPFCERLCPYCSFNRFPFSEERARPYFENMRKEMRMLKDLGYDFDSVYIGGGTPTIMIDELCDTIDQARELFNIQEVSSETNPNHLIPSYLDKLQGRVQRLSVGVQSFNNDLLKQMDRYKKYGSGEEIFERIGQAAPYFDSVNVDMIFNFPSQTEDILLDDLEKIVACGARQTTFSPLYVSSATTRKMEKSLGKMDYNREFRYYQILDEVLCGGEHPFFSRDTIWTFNRLNQQGAHDHNLYAEELQVAYNEYPGIGSGSITHLNGALYVNTFSLKEYNEAIEAGHMSIMGKCVMSKRDLARYYFLLHLYQLRLDKNDFKKQFGCSIERLLPAEMAFYRAHRAFATDNRDELTLTTMGRYLTLILYRQFLSGMNNLRDQARDALDGEEHNLLFGDETNCSACLE